MGYRTILVLSGKGGVGKSTVAVQLAMALSSCGKKVGVLDIDLCGPSVPHLMGVEGADVMHGEKGWVPVQAAPSVSVMSIAFLLPDRDAPVVWRGPKKDSMINQFLDDVDWGEIDFLIVDTPPGTSDEHITVCQKLQSMGGVDGCVLVTTPQKVALADVRREITFCRKVKLPIHGLVENMSGYVCPHCAECSNVFSRGGGESLAQHTGIPFLGRIPIDPQLMAKMVGGGPIEERFPPDAHALECLRSFANQLSGGAPRAVE